METKPVLPTLATLIKERRKALGLSNDEQLAALTGRYQTTVSGWRRGDGYPDAGLYQIVADWLGISYDELVEVIVAEHVMAGRRFKRPRGPGADVPGTAAEKAEQAGVTLDGLAARLSSLEQTVAGLMPPPGPSTGRKPPKN